MNVGVAAHITAAAPGGPRHDATLSTDARQHADNAIWLCQTCAKLIDNDVARFPVSVLRSWKRQAEEAALARIGRTATEPIPTQATPSAYRLLLRAAMIVQEAVADVRRRLDGYGVDGLLAFLSAPTRLLDRLELYSPDKDALRDASDIVAAAFRELDLAVVDARRECALVRNTTLTSNRLPNATASIRRTLDNLDRLAESVTRAIANEQTMG